LLVEVSILLDGFRGAVGFVVEVEPKFDAGAGEAARCKRFALSLDFKRILALKVTDTTIASLKKDA
jgi:hypothetical protein